MSALPNPPLWLLHLQRLAVALDKGLLPLPSWPADWGPEPTRAEWAMHLDGFKRRPTLTVIQGGASSA